MRLFEKFNQVAVHPFTKVLYSNKINRVFYATYLYNQGAIYFCLESAAAKQGLLRGLNGLPIASKIEKDHSTLCKSSDNRPMILPVVKDYVSYVNQLAKDDPLKLWAHIYVRHGAHLSTDKWKVKTLPGQRLMHSFTNADALRTVIESKLTPDMTDELIKCLDFEVKLLDQMMKTGIRPT